MFTTRGSGLGGAEQRTCTGGRLLGGFVSAARTGTGHTADPRGGCGYTFKELRDFYARECEAESGMNGQNIN
jgi:hypothetical protein